MRSPAGRDATPSPARPLALAALAALAGAAGGCAFPHRCPVPDPVVEAAPGHRLPLAAQVRYAPPAVPEVVTEQADPYHTWTAEAGAPTRALAGGVLGAAIP